MRPAGPTGQCVVFLGDPVMDLLVHIDDHFLQSNSLRVGGCVPVDSQQLETLLHTIHGHGLRIR